MNTENLFKRLTEFLNSLSYIIDQNYHASTYFISKDLKVIFEHTATSDSIKDLVAKFQKSFTLSNSTMEKSIVEVMGARSQGHFIDECGFGVISIPILGIENNLLGSIVIHGLFFSEQWEEHLRRLSSGSSKSINSVEAVYYQNKFCMKTSDLLNALSLLNASVSCYLHEKGQSHAEGESRLASDLFIDFEGIVGQSKSMQNLYEEIRRVAETSSPVLIHGESGTGKELVARAIVSQSVRRNNAFLSINCGSLNENLLESELFGHVKGAFTGANANRSGLFASANGGTIFLDEIGEASPGLQTKLLRVIQHGTYFPLGSTKECKTDARVLTATHVNLEEYIKKEMFREDLFYRINVLNVRVPPLRKRKSDIVKLTKYFVTKYCEKENMPAFEIPVNVFDQLELYDWPGNVRQLENEILRICVLSNKGILDVKSLSSKISKSRRSKVEIHNSIKQELLDHERVLLLEGFEKHTGNIAKQAKEMGLSRAQLNRKLKDHGIGPFEKKVS